MMTKDSARAAAAEYVTDTGQRIGVELAILDDQTVEFNSGWVFFYDSRKYIESGSPSDALAGNAPVIVSKRDGSVHVTGTARPVEDYVREFEARQ
jgi:hypothetical protein